MVLPFRGHFPETRLRRMRRHAWSREWLREHRLTPHNLVQPLFVREETMEESAHAMPAMTPVTLDGLIQKGREALSYGIGSVMLFPIVPASKKDERASDAVNPDNLICRAIKHLRHHVPSLGVICDVALDPYTSHGHDGLWRHGDVDNDKTLEILTRQAIMQADAGCHVLAPSDMMDGRIGAIRQALDRHGAHHVLILSYAAKYASSLYAPFRDVLGSTRSLQGASKEQYQMAIANREEALREVMMDIEEGADMVMVKPGLCYLDVLHCLKEHYAFPLAAYHVSGEYAMLHAAAEKGYLSYDDALLESLLAIKRAGATMIISYGALDAARLLQP
ncbi:MAG: porphobilinogen synthase [Alphaproteobacteria bacterium GM7ARS4]|nr:porphobilinogen synthase [Alphaproteobacteria bacterium GM7ARS4]